MKLNAKDVLKPAAILFAICVIVAAALAGTNLLTEDKIAQQAAAKAEESRKLVIPIAAYFEELDETEYPPKWEGGTVYKAWYEKDAESKWVCGYVFETSAKGYGGDVKVMTGIAGIGADYAEVTGVVILSHGETPGLGANAEKEEFRNQYQQALPKNGLEIVKYQTPAEGEIEAMTGATITSTAVTNAVNQAIEQWYEVTAWQGQLATM